MRKYLELIDKSTRGRYDVTPIFADFQAFSELIQDLVELCHGVDFDVIGGIDALGFILGTGMALETRKPLVPIRKGGKLPTEVEQVEFVDYTGQIKSLEIRVNALNSGEKVLIVDEWVETGAQIKAAIQLVEARGGEVAGILTINADQNQATRELGQKYRMLCLTQEI
jgi:adenine phosphoribosyltransferase